MLALVTRRALRVVLVQCKSSLEMQRLKQEGKSIFSASLDLHWVDWHRPQDTDSQLVLFSPQHPELGLGIR